ncbi:claudin-4-like [Erpetoichthys calabaricus]|uniref:claudin-4-like n=1 Tax=Erpetoichthys calabaricus TaxID=27687 RepID=UPI0010A08459|nr:claudin-4-like [Erpetoichthys calabaricus]
MAATGLQLLGLFLCITGWLGGAITCALPMWRVTAFIGNNIVVAQTTWEGLWMSCIVQSTGEFQCKMYDSMLALSQGVQAARALTVISVLLSILALMLGVVGAKCTNCMREGILKTRIIIAAGTLYGIAGFLYLIPVCWTANTIIKDFYNPAVPAVKKRELGPALYFGWAASALLLLGAVLLCSGSTGPSPNYSSQHSSPRHGATLPAEQVKGYV